MTSLDENEYRGNVGRGLNLQASAGLCDIPNGARDRMYSEKGFPGLQHAPSRRRLPSIHERSLFCIGDQPETRLITVHVGSGALLGVRGGVEATNTSPSAVITDRYST
jgi:hypothetical protein